MQNASKIMIITICTLFASFSFTWKGPARQCRYSSMAAKKGGFQKRLWPQIIAFAMLTLPIKLICVQQCSVKGKVQKKTRTKKLTSVSFAFTHTYTPVKNNIFPFFPQAYMENCLLLEEKRKKKT